MARIRAQVITRGASQLPVDHVVNTVHFSRAGAWSLLSDLEWNTIANDVRNVFATTRQYIPPDYGVQVKLYNLDDPEPRFPRYTTAWTAYTQAGGVHGPREVALAVGRARRAAGGRAERATRPGQSPPGGPRSTRSSRRASCCPGGAAATWRPSAELRTILDC